MQATLFCHLVLFVLVTLATRTYQCSCNNTEIDGATWGSWVGEGVCSGQCNDAVLERTRQCHVQGGVGTTPHVENCSISSKSDCGECLGEWSVWSSSGGCSTACGMGIQKRSRTCYMVGDKIIWYYWSVNIPLINKLSTDDSLCTVRSKFRQSFLLTSHFW